MRILVKFSPMRRKVKVAVLRVKNTVPEELFTPMRAVRPPDWRPALRPSDKAWASLGPVPLRLLDEKLVLGVLCHSPRAFEAQERPTTVAEVRSKWPQLVDYGVDRYFVDGICDPPAGYRLITNGDSLYCLAARKWHGPPYHYD